MFTKNQALAKLKVSVRKSYDKEVPILNRTFTVNITSSFLRPEVSVREHLQGAVTKIS